MVNSGRKMSSFGLVSSQTQYFLAALLSDDEFVERFLAESARRLAARHSHFTKGLEKVNITCLPSNAGLFFWMNLRGLLKEKTFEGGNEYMHVGILNHSQFECETLSVFV